jgi:hypothetical protein
VISRALGSSRSPFPSDMSSRRLSAIYRDGLSAVPLKDRNGAGRAVQNAKPNDRIGRIPILQFWRPVMSIWLKSGRLLAN